MPTPCCPARAAPLNGVAPSPTRIWPCARWWTVSISAGAQLRASLEGQQLSIDQFTLQGAGGASGGLLSATSSTQWLPSIDPQATAASRVRMNIEATAKALRLSARADRRLVISGKLQADSALFILPKGTAPRLGDNVKDVNQDAAKKASTTRSAGDVKAPPHHDRPSHKHAGFFVECFL